LDELDEKPNQQKFQSFEILKERVARQRTHLKSHLIKKLCSMGSKKLALDVCHMCNLAKKHVWLSIEIHFGIFLRFSSFVALNKNIHYV
jgi:hypothetical protein